MEKLFEEFKGVNLDEWLAKINVDLKGKPLDVLHTRPEMDLEIKAYHHPEEGRPVKKAYSKSTNDWKIRKAYTSEPNKELLQDLNDGITALGLLHTPVFASQTNSVLFEHITTDISLIDLVDDYSIFPEKANLNFDIFGQSILSGKWMHEKESFIKFYQATSNRKNLWISGSVYGDTGATSVQELAFTASHLNEYIHLLTNAGVSLNEINQNLCIEISITDNYFVNIAKTRAIRSIVKGIFEAYDSNHKHQEFTLYAKTSCRFLAENDANNNLLRETTQAMSAVLGGCDVLTVQPLISGNHETNELNKRMAKNIQLILKEESYLDKVVDPGQGSYYIESLTDQILEKSWDLFKRLESEGGFCASIESGSIQDLIEQNRNFLSQQLNENQKTFLGVNKFHSSLEDWKDKTVNYTPQQIDFKSLTPFKLESFYKKTEKV